MAMPPAAFAPGLAGQIAQIMQDGVGDDLKPHLGGPQRGRQLQQGGDQGGNRRTVPIQGLQIQNLQRRRLDGIALAHQGEGVAGDLAVQNTGEMERTGRQVRVR
ncbi:hypothetical protein D3C87_1136880 [compost metagenome]